jgi:hypothetical protein
MDLATLMLLKCAKRQGHTYVLFSEVVTDVELWCSCAVKYAQSTRTEGVLGHEIKLPHILIFT